MNNKKRIVIVGGGVAGLSAAYYLQKKYAAQNMPVELILVESSLRLGGKIQTELHRDFIIERGPESFLDTNGYVRQLAKDLQIEHYMKRNEHFQSYMVNRLGTFVLPSKSIFGEQFDMRSIMKSGILSFSGKLRAAGDLVLPKVHHHEDEPITNFFSRRFGSEFVENVAEPLLAATFAGDIDHLSVQSMFPRFYNLKKNNRSMLLGIKRANLYPLIEDGYLHYETFENGLTTLVNALHQQLTAVQIMRGVKVIGMDPTERGMLLHFNNIASIEADGVVMATPFPILQQVLQKHVDLPPVAVIRNASIATVNMAFKSKDIPKLKDALNFFASRTSGYSITTCTWSNRKWSNIAPEGYDLLRVYIGRVGDEAVVELSDTEIEQIVLRDLQQILGIGVTPLFTVVSRWKEAMPQYTVGHEERVKTLKKQLHKRFPTLYIAGSSYKGISIPRCIHQGKEAADHLFAQLEYQATAR